MLLKEKYLKRKFRGLALRIFNRLENNNNSDFDTNGEARLVQALVEYFAKQSGGGKKNVVAFDLGANVGNYSGLLLSLIKPGDGQFHIHLFEPTKSCFETLTGKFAGEPRVTLNNLAVSDKEESCEIYYDSEKSTLASLYQRDLSAYSLKLSEKETIHTVRLDAYIEAHKIAHINFMKFDIEGHEIPAFRGLGEYLNGDFIDFIQFEYGGANLDSHTSLMEMYAMLEAMGFVVAKVMPAGLEIRKYQSWMDNFSYSNYVAISQNVARMLS